MAERKKKETSDWELESALDISITLEDLISSPPFRDASDEHGHSVTAGTRIPQWLHRRVIRLREMIGSPYALNSDVLRDAVYIGMQILHMRYKASPDWEVEKRLAAVVDASGASKRIKGQFEELLIGLEELYRGGDETQAAQRLTEYVYAVVRLENDWHRDKLFKLLQDSRIVKEVAEYCSEEIRKLIRGKK